MSGDAAPIRSASRLFFLDWLRILAFGLLVLYHVGMYYVDWNWHVKSPHASAALAPWMLLSSPWRMDLLFLVSGAATGFMLMRAGARGALLRERARRLLPPLVFGMLVIVPPQSYFEVVRRFGFDGGYGEFLSLYLRGDRRFCADGSCLLLPTWNHLWYLPYLASYTLSLWIAVRARPALLPRLAAAVAPRVGGAAWLALPVLLLALSRWTLRTRFPETHALIDDWFLHLQQLPIFVLGAVLAFARPVWDRIAAQRRIALAAALVGWLVLVILLPADRGGPFVPWPWADARWVTPMRALAFSVVQWCALVAALGYGRIHLDRDGPARRYLTDAVFPVYILHQTVIIVLSQGIAPLGLSPVTEAPLLVGGAFALSLAGYEAVRRIAPLRPWFGLAPVGSRRRAADVAA